MQSLAVIFLTVVLYLLTLIAGFYLYFSITGRIKVEQTISIAVGLTLVVVFTAVFNRVFLSIVTMTVYALVSWTSVGFAFWKKSKEAKKKVLYSVSE